jgi:hypothetical protein
MSKPSQIEKLNELIALKELQFQFEKKELNDEINAFTESLRPINLIKSKIKNALSDAAPFSGMMNGALGYFGGLLAKKIFVGKSDSTLREIEGALLQMLVTSKVSANAEDLKALALSIFHRFSKSKEAE